MCDASKETAAVELPFGIVINNHGGKMASDLAKQFMLEGHLDHSGEWAAHAIESFLLSMHSKGIDLTDSRITSALEEAVEHISNNMPDDEKGAPGNVMQIISDVQGVISIADGIATLPDGSSYDLKAAANQSVASSLSVCHWYGHATNNDPEAAEDLKGYRMTHEISIRDMRQGEGQLAIRVKELGCDGENFLDATFQVDHSSDCKDHVPCVILATDGGDSMVVVQQEGENLVLTLTNGASMSKMTSNDSDDPRYVIF